MSDFATRHAEDDDDDRDALDRARARVATSEDVRDVAARSSSATRGASDDDEG